MRDQDRQPELPLPAPQAVKREAARKRLAAREKRVLAGVDELSRFLQDLIKQGLANTSSAGYRTWDEMASRMVDAQAPGLARMVREIGGIAHMGPDWQDAVIERIGKLHLLLEAYRRIETLDDDLAADVRSLIGFTTRRDSVLALPPVRDTWRAMGRRLELQENLSTARVWLWGETTHRFALFLSFAAAGQAFDAGPAPGSCLDAEIHFYPGAVPLRALIGSSSRVRASRLPPQNVFRSPAEAWDAYARAQIRLPWLERMPAGLRGVVPVPVEHDGQQGWRLQDERHALTMHPFGRDGWTLLALSGGRPVDVFGELNGRGFIPFACVSHEGFSVLARNPLYAEMPR